MSLIEMHICHSLQAEPMKQPPKMTNAPWYSSLKWRLVISLLTLGTGVFFAFTACMYPLRVVQRMSYVRGRGGGVAIITFSPIKGTRYTHTHTHTHLPVSYVHIPSQPCLFNFVCAFPLLHLHNDVGTIESHI